jgi:hypothetical protein
MLHRPQEENYLCYPNPKFGNFSKIYNFARI